MTMHSQEEDLHNHIGILDTVVNRFPVQILFTNTKVTEFEISNNKKKIYISLEDLDNNLEDILRKHIKSGKVGIYTDLDDQKYNILQKKIN